MPAATLDLVAPAFVWEPPRAVTDGPLVAELCEAVGFVPDPEQRLILDATFADPPPRDVGIVAPRQNLKTATLQMMALGWLFITGERLVVWSAHEFNTAAEAFRDMVALIEGHPDLRGELLHVHRTSGAEAIELRDGRRLRFKARTKGGGRGLTGNRIVLDEAMYLRPDHLGALVPTLRAVVDPQLVYAGSAGMLDSAEWRRVRDRGRAGGDRDMAYFEWCDPDPGCADAECTHWPPGVPGCALDDEARWVCNTALGRRITLDTLRADRRTLPPMEFARETLGWWEDPPAGDSDDALAGWVDRARPTAAPGDPVALGVDVSPNMASAAIVACGRGPDGLLVLEVVEHRRGTQWVADRLAELRARHGVAGVGAVAGSPAEALDLPEVRYLKAGETTAGCAAFARDVNEGGLAHRDDDRLNAAVAGAVRRFAGDGWRWSRRESGTDISPLYAAVVARFLLERVDMVDRSTEALMGSFG